MEKDSHQAKPGQFDQIFQPGIVAIFAAPGHGKTCALRRFVATGTGRNFLTIDVIDPLYVMRQLYPGKKQITFHDSIESYWPIYCRITHQKPHERKPRLVVMDEIGFLLAESAAAKSQARRIFKTCRNFNLTLITADQRTAESTRTLTACARLRMWGRIKDPLDLKYAEDFGVDSRKLLTLPKHSFLIQNCYV